MSKLISSLLNLPIFLLCLLAQAPAHATAVEVSGNQLLVDGIKQPQLFGAEVQYFRLRGGYGPNIPRAKVLALWNKALDKVVEAKMNAISFYIPWDFHEYAEGKFDFTGTADVDHDGLPDYPSRDVVTFFKLIAAHRITRVLVRPGPYINAEWGFLGFGAIPSWFHDKYPESHMRTPNSLRSGLYDYNNPDLLRSTALWFKALNEQVLSAQIGPGKPVIFLQLDNETNYQWQSIYNVDFSQSTISRYQDFLQNLFQDIGRLNQIQGRQWERWNQIQPPTEPGRNISEDQTWYQFADRTIFGYLNKIRNLWEQLGVSEPGVMFTLAESYNAAKDGLLPNFVLDNAKQTTGLMTVNLYPKTVEDAEKPLLNFPFKADLDVKSASEANKTYFGSAQEWAMGPEIQGGWWRGTDVSPEARQQTYLTVLGHGLKAFFVYYFNEGQNWDVEWTYNQIKPLFDQLAWERHLVSMPLANLPANFWGELQARCDKQILVGFDARRIMTAGPNSNINLFFDSPLDGDANPRNHYFQLQQIGERVIAPYQDFLARSLEVNDDVALVKDSTSHQPVADQNISSVQAAAEWNGGLLGYLMNADINPRVLYGDLSDEDSFGQPKMLVHLDTGLNAPRTIEMLKRTLERGQTVVNFLASDVPDQLGVKITPTVLSMRAPNASQVPVPLTYYIDHQGHLTSALASSTPVTIMSSNPVYQYELGSQNTGCDGILYSQNKVVGYRCRQNQGTLVQIGALLFEDYNSDRYAGMASATESKALLKSLLADAHVKPKLLLSETASQTVAFARKDPQQKILWITVKTGSTSPQKFFLKVDADLLQPSPAYSVTDLLAQKTINLSRAALTQTGLPITLAPNGSAVYVVKGASARSTPP